MRVIRLKEVLKMTSLSRSTVRRLEEAGRFPARLALSAGVIGWLEGDVIDWLRQRKSSYANSDPASPRGKDIRTPIVIQQVHAEKTLDV